MCRGVTLAPHRDNVPVMAAVVFSLDEIAHSVPVSKGNDSEHGRRLWPRGLPVHARLALTEARRTRQEKVGAGALRAQQYRLTRSDRVWQTRPDPVREQQEHVGGGLPGNATSAIRDPLGFVSRSSLRSFPASIITVDAVLLRHVHSVVVVTPSCSIYIDSMPVMG